MTNSIVSLVRFCAMIVLLSSSFTSPITGTAANPINVNSSSQPFTPAINTATSPVINRIDSAEVGQPVADTILYLPFATNNQHTYLGIITDNGVPVPDQAVDLRFYDGSVWSTYETQVTDATGTFYFTNLPNLTAGQGYYARWFNALDNTNYLSAYYCDIVDLDNIDFGWLSCEFNIHNVFHVTPANAASVRLPNTFAWTLRPTTIDSYELNISDTTDDIPWWWTDPPLGYTNTYKLNSLPAVLQTNVVYGWFMGVYGLNGMGYSYYYRNITFQNSGNVVFGPEIPLQNSHILERKEMELIPIVKE